MLILKEMYLTKSDHIRHGNIFPNLIRPLLLSQMMILRYPHMYIVQAYYPPGDFPGKTMNSPELRSPDIKQQSRQNNYPSPPEEPT